MQLLLVVRAEEEEGKVKLEVLQHHQFLDYLILAEAVEEQAKVMLQALLEVQALSL